MPAAPSTSNVPRFPRTKLASSTSTAVSAAVTSAPVSTAKRETRAEVKPQRFIQIYKSRYVVSNLVLFYIEFTLTLKVFYLGVIYRTYTIKSL